MASLIAVAMEIVIVIAIAIISPASPIRTR